MAKCSLYYLSPSISSCDNTRQGLVFKENSDFETLSVDDRCFTDSSDEALTWLFIMGAGVEIESFYFSAPANKGTVSIV